jgi:hypothetical protein
MKYNNKNAIALVLLASSAFCASSVPTEPKYDDIIKEVLALLDSDKKLGQIDLTSQPNLNLSPEQLAAFGSRKGEELDDAKIKGILKEVYDGQVTAYNAELEAKASAIMLASSSDPISRNLFADYGSNLTQGQYDSIAEYEYKAGKPLTKDELLDFLKDSTTLPPVNDNPSDVASRIFRIAHGKKISGIANEKFRKIDLDDDKFEIIKQVEAVLSNPLSKDQLEQFLTNNNFHHLEVDVRVKAILTLADAKDKVSDLDDATLKVYAKDKQIEFIKFYELKESKKAYKALLDDILNTSDDSLDKMMAPAPNPSLDLNSSNSTHAPAANPSNGTPASTANPSNGTPDLIAKIKVALADKDFSEMSADAIKALGLSDKQVEALKKANVTKDTTDEDINKALKGEAETTPNTQNKEDGANKTTDDPIAKIKVALASVDDFSKLSADAIKALGLTEKQVEALKKANVTKATTDEDINKALKGEAEATTSSGSSSVTDSGTEKGKNAEIPFYKNPWIMVPSGVILLSAIGGGVFMMTRKTEDTDL